MKVFLWSYCLPLSSPSNWRSLENQIALVVRPKLLDALAADAELGVRLRAFGDGVLYAAIERRDVDFRAERRLREGNRHFEAQICTLAAE